MGIEIEYNFSKKQAIVKSVKLGSIADGKIKSGDIILTDQMEMI